MVRDSVIFMTVNNIGRNTAGDNSVVEPTIRTRGTRSRTQVAAEAIYVSGEPDKHQPTSGFFERIASAKRLAAEVNDSYRNDPKGRAILMLDAEAEYTSAVKSREIIAAAFYRVFIDNVNIRRED